MGLSQFLWLLGILVFGPILAVGALRIKDPENRYNINYRNYYFFMLALTAVIVGSVAFGATRP